MTPLECEVTKKIETFTHREQWLQNLFYCSHCGAEIRELNKKQEYCWHFHSKENSRFTSCSLVWEQITHTVNTNHIV